MKTALINKIRTVLLELGKGFSFVGNQYKISIDNQDFHYVVVELKASKFKPGNNKKRIWCTYDWFIIM